MKNPKIQPLRAASRDATDLTKQEERFYELVPEAREPHQDRFVFTTEQVEAAMGQKRVEELGVDIELRKTYANKAFLLAVGWIAGILLLLVMNSSEDSINLSYWGGLYHLRVRISDTVMLALVGSTTLNILGGFYLVLKYLFKAKPEPEQKKPQSS